MIPTYTLIVIGACAETLIIGGLAVFAPKDLEEKFDILPSDSGFIMDKTSFSFVSRGPLSGSLSSWSRLFFELFLDTRMQT